MEEPEKSDKAAHTAASHLHEEIYSPSGSIRRIIYITLLAVVNAVIVGVLAKLLVLLINLVTNLSFYGTFSVHETSPAHHQLGYFVVIVPVIGGLIVGLMARFGSRAIRGHGIPEAMEKIITDESKIPPVITILKPLSAAISIGTGGPFGAEGPIISTGGALGSFCGQTLHITAQERKVLLAAGATAGMTAIFGTPFAAILLAIELLLFEFSPRSFLPVMMACITGACMHFILFSTEPTFPMPEIVAPDSMGVLVYALMGLMVGLASVLVTRAVYLIEDVFEKLPVHWMWWPAIGALAVGAVGLIAPRTLGVGYENITDALSGTLPVQILVTLCLWKFVSWAIALGSGTSGGTLAPLLTIGSAMGCLLGMAVNYYWPSVSISVSLAALVGMAALFAGSSRAILTSIVFALETTMQESTLLPLIAGCSTAYLVSFVMMRTTIMTEKIKRRGIQLPEHYRPDVLTLHVVSDVMRSLDRTLPAFDAGERVGAALDSLRSGSHSYVVVTSKAGPVGVLRSKELYDCPDDTIALASYVKHNSLSTIYADNTLDIALEVMLRTKQTVLMVTDRKTRKVSGFVTEWDILKVFEQRFMEDKDIKRHISLKSRAWRMIRGRGL